MTPEEIQQNIEQILSIQRQIQETQLKDHTEISELSAQVSELSTKVSKLISHSKKQDKLIEKLIAYSLTGEPKRLYLEKRVKNLERKMKKMKSK
ncbi:MAG: hypothetical protein F6K47_36140 [Symploca sp. SIO2E6]|nr:hypothetical protein [Symploca sp. SIO2E6]